MKKRSFPKVSTRAARQRPRSEPLRASSGTNQQAQQQWEFASGGKTPRWLCTRCETVNPAKAPKCINSKCFLARKVVGVDILPDEAVLLPDEAALLRAPVDPAPAAGGYVPGSPTLDARLSDLSDAVPELRANPPYDAELRIGDRLSDSGKEEAVRPAQPHWEGEEVGWSEEDEASVPTSDSGAPPAPAGSDPDDPLASTSGDWLFSQLARIVNHGEALEGSVQKTDYWDAATGWDMMGLQDDLALYTGVDDECMPTGLHVPSKLL